MLISSRAVLLLKDTPPKPVQDFCSALFDHPSNGLFLARITAVEVASALARKLKNGAITLQQHDKAVRRFKREFQNRYVKIDITSTLINNAVSLVRKYALRGYDAVQLAAAIELAKQRGTLSLPPLVFVCANSELNIAASAEGLSVENPNNYP